MRCLKENYIEIVIAIGHFFHLFERTVAGMFSKDFNNASLRSLYASISRIVPLTTFLMTLFSLLLIIKSVRQKKFVALIVSIITLIFFARILVDIIISV